jgi:hypothetical protein
VEEKVEAKVEEKVEEKVLAKVVEKVVEKVEEKVEEVRITYSISNLTFHSLTLLYLGHFGHGPSKGWKGNQNIRNPNIHSFTICIIIF